VICRRAVEVVTEALDGPLPLGERIGLGVHTLFCSPCRRFRRQMTRVHTALERAAEGGEGPAADGLSDEARARIEARLSRSDEPG
jgi:hypothetical protein